MLTSERELRKESEEHGYRAEILEKVYRLLELTDDFMNVPYLRERLALKGGTAINLFCSEHLPRLSVDLDFNYIGSLDRDLMKKEKLEIENIILNICQRRRYQLHRNPRAHAGGKMVLVFPGILGNKGRLEIDLNYIFRIPLWPIEWRSSPDWPKRTEISILNIHELAAGKLHALLGREASRDLFDSHRLLTEWLLDRQKLRLAFTVYAGMEQDHWQRIHPDNIKFTVKDIRDKLIPVLQKNISPFTKADAIESWANQLMQETKAALNAVLPFSEEEKAFLDCLKHHGEIKPEFICADDNFCERVKMHPSLLWRIQQNKK
ncbi:MAG: nucleotidyl transferase AbiEii/AbiGii toxin family protein [Proteobacteria bacterium]|nr:nucleotidyl transferase AbiEii/AbiGii toxin family protein [Pseudomonadota bacterium]